MNTEERVQELRRNFMQEFGLPQVILKDKQGDPFGIYVIEEEDQICVRASIERSKGIDFIGKYYFIMEGMIRSHYIKKCLETKLPEKIGIGTSNLAIDRDYHNRGIGTALMQIMIERLKKREAIHVVTLGDEGVLLRERFLNAGYTSTKYKLGMELFNDSNGCLYKVYQPRTEEIKQILVHNL